MRFLKALRYKTIELLAGNSIVVLNVSMKNGVITVPKDTQGLIKHCTFSGYNPFVYQPQDTNVVSR